MATGRRRDRMDRCAAQVINIRHPLSLSGSGEGAGQRAGAVVYVFVSRNNSKPSSRQGVRNTGGVVCVCAIARVRRK